MAATKDQERKALEKIRKIVEGLSKGDAAVVAEPFGYTEGMKVGVTKYDF